MAEARENGWIKHRFDALATMITDRIDKPSAAAVDRYVGLEHLDPGSLKITRWGVPSDVEATKLLFRTGDIIFGRRRAYQRKVAVADFDGICSAHAMVLRARPENVWPEFLPFFMQGDAFMARAQEISVGSLSPTINWKTLAEQEFALPPLAEQRVLASVLSSAAAVASTLKAAHLQAEQVALAASSALYARTLADAGSAAPTKLGSMLENIQETGHTDLPKLSVTIDGRVVRRDSLGRRVSDEMESERYISALPGDLAYNTMRLWQGAIGIVRERGLISPAYTVMRIRDGRYPPEYFWEMLRSPAFQREFRKLTRGVAPDRWRIYFKDLATISISLPIPGDAIRDLQHLVLVRQACDRIADRQRAAATFNALLGEAILRGRA